MDAARARSPSPTRRRVPFTDASRRRLDPPTACRVARPHARLRPRRQRLPRASGLPRRRHRAVTAGESCIAKAERSSVGSNAMAHPDSFGARVDALRSATRRTRSSGSTRSSRATTSRACRTRCAILLENVLRREDGATVTAADVEAVATWDATAEPSREITFAPARVLLQDFTGVPAVVDLAAMRDAMRELRRRPEPDRPAHPRRARDRPLGAGRRLREPARDPAERRARVQAEPRALRLPPLGPGRVRRAQGRAAEHGHLPPGQPRVPRPRRRVRATGRRSPTRSSAPTRTRR